MKLLLDSCVWGGALDALRDAGHDVEWCGNWSKDPGDDEILAAAFREGRILVTLDKDFGELAILRGLPHCGIVRLVDISATRQAAVCLAVFAAHGDELALGGIATAERGRLRFRPPTEQNP
jgi:predicted nuclease of predicted toxin-antitoxin system